jgi:6-phosphogluconolactonase (cycloisomerase 2 family)
MSSQHIFVCDGRAIKQIRIDDGQLIRRIQLQQSHQNSMCISPDEQFLYVSYQYFYFGEGENTITIEKYRIDDGSLIPMGECDCGDHMCISHDGEHLFISRHNNDEIQVIETENGNEVGTIELQQRVMGGSMCISPCGKFLFVADNRCKDSQIHILDISGGDGGDGGDEYRILHTPNMNYGSISISRDGAFIFASNAFNNRIQVLSSEDGSVVRTIHCASVNKIDSMCMSPDDQEIFVNNIGSSLVHVFSGM